MKFYELKYMFDWGSGTCLWAVNQDAKNKFGYSVEIRDLPISSELKQQVFYLIEWHDKALDWENPSNGLLWNEKEIERFKIEAKELYHSLCDELGSLYSIVYQDEHLM